MRCDKKYNVHFLSLYIDKALKIQVPINDHVSQCINCQQRVKTIQQLEQQIFEYEKNQENFAAIELFDTVHQQRKIFKLTWNSLCLSLSEDSTLEESHSDNNCLQFYLQQFWYGQVGIYISNYDFPLSLTLQRGRRLFIIKPKKSKRIIENDSVLLLDKSIPIAQMSLRIPQAFKESSITRKYRSLALGSQTFVTRFFAKTSSIHIAAAWENIKHSLFVRDIGIYLMHLNTDSTYQKIAKDFRTVPNYVGKIIAKVRTKLLAQCS